MILAAEALGIDLVDLLRARGPGGKPAVLGDHLDAAEGGAIAGGGGELGRDRIAGQRGEGELAGRERGQQLLLLGRGRGIDPLIEGLAQFLCQRIIGLARVPLGLGGDFRGQQIGNQPVLVRRPDGSVAPEEGGTGALLAGEAERAGEKAVDEPFEAHRHLDQLAAELGRDAVDDGAADDGLAHAAAGPPIGAVLEEIGYGRRQIMIGIHQPLGSRHDSMPVGIRVIGEGDIEFVAHGDQPRHGIRRGAVHPDPPIPIQRHEAEGRIDGRR